jgi:hypothetical protein
MLIRVKFMLRAIYFSGRKLVLSIEKGTCDFVEKRLLLSWTHSPPNLRILKQKKVDPYGSMTIEDGCNV